MGQGQVWSMMKVCPREGMGQALGTVIGGGILWVVRCLKCFYLQYWKESPTVTSCLQSNIMRRDERDHR